MVCLMTCYTACTSNSINHRARQQFLNRLDNLYVVAISDHFKTFVINKFLRYL